MHAIKSYETSFTYIHTYIHTNGYWNFKLTALYSFSASSIQLGLIAFGSVFSFSSSKLTDAIISGEQYNNEVPNTSVQYCIYVRMYAITQLWMLFTYTYQSSIMGLLIHFSIWMSKFQFGRTIDFQWGNQRYSVIMFLSTSKKWLANFQPLFWVVHAY